jgi:uncharacterized protein YcfL
MKKLAVIAATAAFLLVACEKKTDEGAAKDSTAVVVDTAKKADSVKVDTAKKDTAKKDTAAKK